ncbi:MAG: hypothetical protein M1816_008215 [Peltula sp. TS41687]|nr:MAG: hypothetical protein M1816_008215 [Peltula sp. TS41687]
MSNEASINFPVWWQVGEREVTLPTRATDPRIDKDNRTGIDIIVTHDCGHVVPGRVTLVPDHGHKECRQCAWRATFHEVEKLRRANRREAEALRRAGNLPQDIWDACILAHAVEYDSMYDRHLPRPRSQAADVFEVNSLQWHRVTFTFEQSISKSLRTGMEAWVEKWGRPTDAEVKRWIHWQLQAAAEFEAPGMRLM